MQMKKFFSALLAVLLAFQVGLAASAAPANSQTAQAPYSILDKFYLTAAPHLC